MKLANMTVQSYFQSTKSNVNDIFKVFVTESQRSNQGGDKPTNFTYTGPSMIGLKCSKMNTAKLTYGHEFILESTQIRDSVTDFSKEDSKERKARKKVINFNQFVNKRVSSANPMAKTNPRSSVLRNREVESNYSFLNVSENASTGQIFVKDSKNNVVQ